MHLTVEYLYNLDYSDRLPDELLIPLKRDEQDQDRDEFEDTPEYTPPESPVVVTVPDDLDLPAAPSTEVIPAFAEPTPDQPPEKEMSELTKDEKKKKKKRRSLEPKSSETPTEPDGLGILTEPPKVSPPEPVTRLEPGVPVQEDVWAPWGRKKRKSADKPPPAPQPVPGNYKLVMHVKVHALAAKYGIDGLHALAFRKFESQADMGWIDSDFVEAAREVYASPFLGKGWDMEMRQAVTALLYQHCGDELLDRDDMQEILRGDMGLDLIKKLRDEGVWKR